MSSAVSSITRAATRAKDEPLRIITTPTHERYESALSRTNAVFYAVRGPNLKDWNSTFAKTPDNYILLNPEQGGFQIPEHLGFDLVLCQNKQGSYHVLRDLANQLHLPLLSLEHTLPHPSWTPAFLKQIRNLKSDVNVFISEFSREAWGWGEDEAEVVHHGIDTKHFSPAQLIVPKKHHVLSVVNDWINRDWCCGFSVWRDVVRDDIPVSVVGDTPGLSKPAKDIHELVWKYRESAVFLNTSTVSPIPTALMEAMACGLPVVSTATGMIPEVIEHGVNGFISNDPAELRQFVIELLGDKDLRDEVGRAARKTIVERFSLEQFVSRWNEVFRRAADIRFSGPA